MKLKAPMTKGTLKTVVTHIPFEAAVAVLSMVFACGVLGGTVGFAELMRRHAPDSPNGGNQKSDPAAIASAAATTALAEQGRHLYLTNCAHCHADDATGDEGPDLHGVRKSDARIAAIIQSGIKGEMPKFGQKLKGEEVRELIAYLRSLKQK